MKRPAFQFYPADWLRDTALRTCSIKARGLWIDMICFMHEGSPYGFLKVNHKVILPANLAQMVGLTLQETEGCLNELAEAGVFETDAEGVIFSRRMIRDENIRNARASGGKLGGNPALKVNLPPNLPPNLPDATKDNQKPTPSSSSSTSSNIVVDIERAGETGFDIPDLKTVLAFAETIGLAPWKAEDWFYEMEGCGWLDWLKRPVAKWQPLLNRIKTKWESDGRPDGPNKSKGFTPTTKKEERTTEFGY